MFSLMTFISIISLNTVINETKRDKTPQIIQDKDIQIHIDDTGNCVYKKHINTNISFIEKCY